MSTHLRIDCVLFIFDRWAGLNFDGVERLGSAPTDVNSNPVSIAGCLRFAVSAPASKGCGGGRKPRSAAAIIARGDVSHSWGAAFVMWLALFKG